MFELRVKANFEAAHKLVDYPGKCSRLHGHNWNVEAVIKGRELDRLGMLVDFKTIKQELNAVIDSLDHQYLNELAVFSSISPTAENIARYIFTELSCCDIFPSDVKLVAISVWESPYSCVTYSPDED